ncbi:hypothetical protein CFOL_v3_12849, partial [Cephalotus follicularis]
FSQFISNFHMNEVDCSLPKLVGMLRTVEADLDIGKSKSAIMFLPSSSKTTQNKGGSKKKGKAMKKKKKSIKKEKPQGVVGACFHCGKQGQWKKDCKEFLASTAGASGSGTYMINLHVASNFSYTWVLDTGCGTNICNSWQGLRSARQLRAEEAVDRRLGDGSRIITRVIGVFDFHLFNGFVISLDPCYLV